MIAEKPQDIQLGIRIGQALFDRLVERQREVTKLTGIEPSISQIARQLLERGLDVVPGRSRR